MWNPQAAVLLLFLVMIPVPGEGVEFQGLLGSISDCIKVQCAEKIEACEEFYGEDPTPQLKGCVAKSCRGTMIGCMDWIRNALLSAQLIQNPMLTPELIKNIADTSMGIIVDSYLYCFRSSDLQNTTQFVECLLGNLLDRGEPYINLGLGILGFSDTDFLMCYLRKVVRSMVGCINVVDKKYMSQMEENMKLEMASNLHEYVTCAAVSFRGKKCYPIISRIYGSTPGLQTQSKGLFICMINGFLVSTAAC